jgi:uncharacterized OsmC-like protein
MFKVEIATPQIFVSSRRHRYGFAIDESLPNPLEATFAALAGCAGVYALKAAKKLGRDAGEIRITGRQVSRTDNPLLPTKWMTSVEFPETWPQADRETVIKAIQECAVKELILNGKDIQFSVEVTSTPSNSSPAKP